MPSEPTPIRVLTSTPHGGNFDPNPPVKPQLRQSEGNTFMINHLGKQGIPGNGKMVFRGFTLYR